MIFNWLLWCKQTKLSLLLSSFSLIHTWVVKLWNRVTMLWWKSYTCDLTSFNYHNRCRRALTVHNCPYFCQKWEVFKSVEHWVHRRALNWLDCSGKSKQKLIVRIRKLMWWSNKYTASMYGIVISSFWHESNQYHNKQWFRDIFEQISTKKLQFNVS